MSERGGVARILVAEDEPHIAEALVFLLEREGYAVTCVADGAAALAALDSERFDLMILDIMLPRASGFDVAAALQGAGDRPKVCVLSAKGQAADRSRMEALGVDAFVTKPFSNKALMETVDALLRDARRAGDPLEEVAVIKRHDPR